MRLPRRRVPPSDAHRWVSPGVGVAAAILASTGFLPIRPAAAHGACSGSTVTRTYTAESMTFRLHLDLDGCRWWDGSARNLVIWLSRDDGAGPASRYSMTPCEAGPGPDSARPSTCEVSISLPHPASEQAAGYQGEATWEWRDGPRRVSFDTRCSTAAGQARCDDPVSSWHD